MTTTFKIKKNDTKPVLAATLQYSDGTAVDLTGATISFNMGNTDFSTYTSGACVITGSTAGQCEYRWDGNIDTGSKGVYWGEFEVTWSAGSILTLPNDHSLKIDVAEDYD